MPASETQKAWAAGIVDGEGCLRIGIHTNYSRLAISVSQTSDVGEESPPRMLRELQRLWRGNLNPSRHSDPRRKPQWQWQVASRQAENFLRDVAPYVVAKRNQAEVCLRYRSRFIEGRCIRGVLDADRALADELVAMR